MTVGFGLLAGDGFSSRAREFGVEDLEVQVSKPSYPDLKMTSA